MYLIIQTMVMCTYSLCVQRMCHLYIQLMCAGNVSFVRTAYVCRECVICTYSLCVQRMCHLYVQLMCAGNVSFDYKQVVMIYVLYSKVVFIASHKI